MYVENVAKEKGIKYEYVQKHEDKILQRTKENIAKQRK